MLDCMLEPQCDVACLFYFLFHARHGLCVRDRMCAHQCVHSTENRHPHDKHIPVPTLRMNQHAHPTVPMQSVIGPLPAVTKK